MKTNYSKQKSQAFAYFRVNKQDARLLSERKFTIYDFVNNSFSFSPKKKEMAIRVLQALKEKPASFAELQARLEMKKSTLFLLLVALEKSGFVEKPGSGTGLGFEKEGKGESFRLSASFSDALSAYAAWWAGWVSEQ